MKLNVDVRRIPEWEVELKSMRETIYNRFRLYSLSEIISAATLIYRHSHVIYEYSISGHSPFGNFEQWKSTLTVDKLIDLGNDFSTPDFLRYGSAIVEKIPSVLKDTENSLAQFRAKGVTDSFIVSLVTSKVTVETLRTFEKQQDEYLAVSREIPKIENALRLLGEVYSQSREYAARVSQIREKLILAEEKRAAIERFEKKHGKVLAKGAAADGKIRKRVTSLKSIVKKTKDCPYCGANLGSDPHLDHIYPVTKGGLSIVENLIWCCSTCNGLKSDKGLMQFLKEQGLPIEQTLTRLHSLGKHV